MTKYYQAVLDKIEKYLSKPGNTLSRKQYGQILIDCSIKHTSEDSFVDAQIEGQERVQEEQSKEMENTKENECFCEDQVNHFYFRGHNSIALLEGDKIVKHRPMTKEEQKDFNNGKNHFKF